MILIDDIKIFHSIEKMLEAPCSRITRQADILPTQQQARLLKEIVK